MYVIITMISSVNHGFTQIKQDYPSGYLELIIGPMFSSKTTTLLEIYKQCVFCNISVSIINHTIDKRYHESFISSHDKIFAPCFQATALSNIWYSEETKIETDSTDSTDSTDVEYNKNANIILKQSSVILINEGQFFSDLYEIVNDMLNNGKKIYVCGLDGDFKKQKFGQILDLIPLCDKVYKLSSLCSVCKNGTLAIFSKRITNEVQQTVVGGSDNYIAVCRKCYNT